LRCGDALASGTASANADTAAPTAVADLERVVMGALLERPTAGCGRLPGGALWARAKYIRVADLERIVIGALLEPPTASCGRWLDGGLER
jgi:hypothetical protein